MKQVLSLFSKNNLIITIGIILILVSVIGLNYLKNIENLEVKKANKDQKILEQTCHKNYCEPDSKCAYSAFVKSEKRSARGGQPEGNYGDCYISQYSKGTKPDIFKGTYKYQNKHYNIPKNRKDIARKICRDNGGVICRKDQLKGRKMCNSAHTERSVGWWGRYHPKGWCGKNNSWNTWTRRNKANVHCCNTDEPKGEFCGEIINKKDFTAKINSIVSNSKNVSIQSNKNFNRISFPAHINACNNTNESGTCDIKRCLYPYKNNIYEKKCNSNKNRLTWMFEPVPGTMDEWRIKARYGSKYLGKKRHWMYRKIYYLTNKSSSKKFNLIPNGKYFKIRDTSGMCILKNKKGTMTAQRGDTLCRNVGTYFQLRSSDGSGKKC